MNRTLTAAVALAAALGTAGMANAQTSSSPTSASPPSASPMTTAPSANQPGMSGTQNPQTMSAPGAASTYGTSPQANTNQMNMGPQGGTQPTQPSQMQATQTGGPASQSQILQVQQQLKSAGLYRGTVDGVMGPETQTALSQYQREQGLPQTSQLDQQTMSRLGGPGMGMSNGATGGSAQPMTPSSPAGAPNPANQSPAGGNSTTGGMNGR